MTVIRPKPSLPLAPPANRPAQKAEVKQVLEQVKDAFQNQRPRLPLDPTVLVPRTHCFPNVGDLFNEGIVPQGGKTGGKITDVVLPPPLPNDGGALADKFYELRLRNMSPKELFVEEAKQREILEDASSGPIQDADAAAKAEKRLEAIEAERERRADAPDLRPDFPHRPKLLPLGAPKYDPDTKIA